MLAVKPKTLVKETIPQSFVSKILRPYQATHTDYLKEAAIVVDGLEQDNSKKKPYMTTVGKFSIPTSCYIDDTGHFNAVEFLICFNQLAYTTYGHMITTGFYADDSLSLPQKQREKLNSITPEVFFDQQLSSMLILKTETQFKKVIDAKNFTAELSINKISLRKNTFFSQAHCKFTDANGGYADGNVLLAYPLNFVQ